MQPLSNPLRLIVLLVFFLALQSIDAQAIELKLKPLAVAPFQFSGAHTEVLGSMGFTKIDLDRLEGEFREQLIKQRCTLVVERENLPEILDAQKVEELLKKEGEISAAERRALRVVADYYVLGALETSDTDGESVRVKVRIKVIDVPHNTRPAEEDTTAFSKNDLLSDSKMEAIMAELAQKVCNALRLYAISESEPSLWHRSCGSRQYPRPLKKDLCFYLELGSAVGTVALSSDKYNHLHGLTKVTYEERRKYNGEVEDAEKWFIGYGVVALLSAVDIISRVRHRPRIEDGLRHAEFMQVNYGVAPLTERGGLFFLRLSFK